MEVEMLSGISSEIMDFLKEYNTGAGFDYIFSVQSGGQIWVGNTDLNITDAVVAGLNQRHRASKNTPKK
jgi:Skp family chaperone for outer membrane proteins